MRRTAFVVVLVLISAACGDAAPGGPTPVPPASPPTAPGASGSGSPVRLIFAGDVMVGRSVGDIAAADPHGLFEDVRFVVTDADVAAFNLESPLTDRPHESENEHALEADPATAALLAAAGFDVASVANNHTGDAGPQSVLDTVGALARAGVAAVGGGRDLAAARAAHIVTVGDIRVGFLAFDATGLGLAAGDGPGAAPWDDGAGPAAVRALAEDADVVAVSVHGGAEYIPVADDAMQAVVETIAEAGADVVWGHGAHVEQPIIVHPRNSGAVSIAASSLGNFIFDQRYPGTDRGILLEVLAGTDGVLAYRVGDVSHGDRRVHFDGWRPPDGAAAFLGGAWWSLPASVTPVARVPAAVPIDFAHDVIAAAIGDATGDGEQDLVIAFRRPFAPNPVNQLDPDHRWHDALGRSAHLGIYRLDGTPLWVAGTLFDPIDDLAVCDGGIAVGYGSFAAAGIVATGALEWEGFGFVTAPLLSGPGTPDCADVDGDGLLDPVVLR